MKINFVTVASDLMASYRYHNLIPAKELGKNHEVTITPWPDDGNDIYCFSKHFNRGDIWYVRGLKSKGKKTVFHVCDNHFDTEHQNHYRNMINEVDEVIVSTEELASVVKIETGREPKVIYDPYEFDSKEPDFKPNGPLKLLWFGHPSNIPGLMTLWPTIRDNYIMIVTSEDVNGKIKIDGKPFPVVKYTKENLLKAFDMCDAVIIPSELGSKQRVKSPNRLVESVQRGKYVLANEIPSYQEFSDMWIGDIKQGLDFLKMQDSETINKRIKNTQEYIRKNHSPEIIGSMWNDVLKGVMNEHANC